MADKDGVKTGGVCLLTLISCFGPRVVEGVFVCSHLQLQLKCLGIMKWRAGRSTGQEIPKILQGAVLRTKGTACPQAVSLNSSYRVVFSKLLLICCFSVHIFLYAIKQT